jgi:AcrR family transcriptional regulator
VYLNASQEVGVVEDSANARRGRPRSAEASRLILDAAVQLLREGGPGAVSIDAVAARSGVARTTIYRRFRDRGQLIAAVLDELVSTEAPPRELPVVDKLRWVLARAADLLERGIGRGGVAALLVGGDAEFTSALRARLAEQLTALGRAMAADVDAGRLERGVDPDALVGLLIGAYLDEMLRYGEPREGWEDRTLDLLARAVVAGG